MKKLLNYLNKVSYWLYFKTSQTTAVPNGQLAVVRVLTGAFMTFFYMPNFSWLANLPDAFFNPPILSITAFFNGFPSITFFRSLDIVLLLSIFCLTLGIKARWAGLVYGLCFTIGSSFEFSLGAVSHVFLLPAVILCTSFSNWGATYALFPDRVYKKFGGLGLSFAGILIAFAFFTAGIYKLFIWIDFDLNTNGFLNWFYSGYFNFGRSQFLTEKVFELPPLLLEIMDYVVIFFEISGVLFLLSGRKYWLSWLLIACSFHLGTTLLLNIHFIQHIPVYVLFLVPPLISFYKGCVLSQKIIFSLLCIPFAIHFYYILSGAPRVFLFSESLLVDQGAMLYTALICWVVLLIAGTVGLFKLHDI